MAFEILKMPPIIPARYYPFSVIAGRCDLRGDTTAAVRVSRRPLHVLVRMLVRNPIVMDLGRLGSGSVGLRRNRFIKVVGRNLLLPVRPNETCRNHRQSQH